MPPRLLYVVNIPRFFVSHRLPLALASRDAGYDVHVATADTDADAMARIRATGLPFHPLPLSQHGTNPLTEARTLYALISLYRHLKPDIVHHVSIKPVLYGGLAAYFAPVGGVISAMSGLGYVFIGDTLRARTLRRLVQPIMTWALRGQYRHMIFQNDDDRERFIRMGIIPSQRAHLIRGSGVDMAHFTPQPMPDGVPVVLFAGRLMWKKGLGAFAEVARRLGHQARFVVVGYAEATSPDNVPPQQLQAWAEEGILEWWGKRDDMPAVFAQSHIVCLPSTYGEGVPKVLIEAAACARPIITTDTPGCRDITRHEVNGLLIPAHGDEARFLDDLTQAVQHLLDDAPLRERMGQAGRTIAQSEFSLQQVISETFALYDRCLPPPIPPK